MTGIQSEDYEQTIQALMNDPIIIQMAEDLKTDLGNHPGLEGEIVHPGGTPRHEFMGGALHEYKHRGGKIASHIGGPAQAVLRLAKKED